MHQLYLRAVWNVSSKNYNIFLYVPVSFQNTVKYEWSKKKTPCFYFNQNMCCVGLYIVSQWLSTVYTSYQVSKDDLKTDFFGL